MKSIKIIEWLLYALHLEGYKYILNLTWLLLVNLEASFTGATWLRRCHSPTNQYHSESSGPTACARVCVAERACMHVCVCVLVCMCVCVWAGESCSSCDCTLPFWPVYRTIITWEETFVQLLLTSSTNEVKCGRTGWTKTRQICRQTDKKTKNYVSLCYSCCVCICLFVYVNAGLCLCVCENVCMWVLHIPINALFFHCLWQDRPD